MSAHNVCYKPKATATAAEVAEQPEWEFLMGGRAEPHLAKLASLPRPLDLTII